jgi:hypothetical protein
MKPLMEYKDSVRGWLRSMAVEATADGSDTAGRRK